MYGLEQNKIGKLLIVDDEIEILEWLEELFTYDYSRELEIHTASSALEALKLLDKVAFDVVLTDIKMPAMDGLTFYRKIKANWPGCKVVFLTGFRNFEDIYEVVRDKDVRYVLKSEEDGVIIQAVDAAFRELDEEIEQKRREEIRQNYVEKARYWIREEYLEHLLQNPGNWVLRKAEELGILFDFSRKMLMCLLRMDAKWGNDLEDSLALEEHAEKIRQYLPEWIQLEKCVFEKRYLVLFIQPKEQEQEAYWKRIFVVVQGAIESYQKVCEGQENAGFSAVISSTEVKLEAAYEEAVQLKKIMVGYLGGMKLAIVHAEKTAELMLPPYTIEQKDKNHGLLKYYLELHQKEEYFSLLNDICRQMSNSRSRHDMQAMELYFNVSTMLLQFINDNHLQEKLAFKIGLYKLLNVDEHKNWIDASEYLTTLSEEIFLILGDYENTLAERALSRIVDYIEDHIDGDLSLTNLASVGGFNASYLSRLFKQVHNETLSDYVLKKRMEKAKLLLEQSQNKVQTVGERVGYPSSNSFSRAFRNYTGLSPVEYREAAIDRSGK